MIDYTIAEMLERISAEIYGQEPRAEVPAEPDARIETRGTVTFPREAEDELLEQIGYEVPPSAIPWGWIVATGSLILGLIICVTRK